MDRWKTYQIPSKLLEYFVKISQETRHPEDENENIETLGLIVGFHENGVVNAKELYLPRQEASATHVNNLGEFDYL